MYMSSPFRHTLQLDNTVLDSSFLRTLHKLDAQTVPKWIHQWRSEQQTPFLCPSYHLCHAAVHFYWELSRCRYDFVPRNLKLRVSRSAYEEVPESGLRPWSVWPRAETANYCLVVRKEANITGPCFLCDSSSTHTHPLLPNDAHIFMPVFPTDRKAKGQKRWMTCPDN